MPVHGFASACSFQPVDRSEASVTLELRDSELTRTHYPFSFALRVRYALTPRALHVELETANLGSGAMPYACGLHPGFAWPYAGGAQNDYQIVFAEPESPEIPIIVDGGLFSDRTRTIPLHGRSLQLDADLFAQEALCFLESRSRAVSFAGPGGAIEVHAEGFRHWALWSRPGAPFLCVEAWTGHGDPETFTGDFREKPSLDRLEPGEMRRHTLRMVVSEV